MRRVHYIIQVALFAVLLLGNKEVSAQTVNDNTEAIDGTDASRSEDISPAGNAVVSADFRLYYFCDDITLDPNYLGNAELMRKIDDHLARSPRIDSITIYAWASPEGVYERNLWLSKKRTETAKKYILDHLPENSTLKAENIRLAPMGENWVGLRKLVEERYTRHDKEKVLAIIDNERIGGDTKKWRLQQLDKGYTWKYIIRKLMPELRVATWICVWEPVAPIVIEPEPKEIRRAEAMAPKSFSYTPVFTAESGGIIPRQTEREFEYQRTILGLKTNMLYDAATLLNYSIEVPINRIFSIQFQQYTPWWLAKKNNLCAQMLTLGGEARWWFAPKTSAASEKFKLRDALVGHHLGVYGLWGKFDFQINHKVGMYQCYAWSAGLSYGYAMPISRHLNLEFSISVGYANVDYQHYIPTDNYELLIRDRDKAGKLHYFGPTKAEISLVIPIRATFKTKDPSKAWKKGGEL